MSQNVGRILTERRRSNAAGYHQKSRDRHNEERLAIEEELADLEGADMSVIHPGYDYENYEDPYPEGDDGIVIVIPPHLIPKATGEDYVPTGDNDADKHDE